MLRYIFHTVRVPPALPRPVPSRLPLLDQDGEGGLRVQVLTGDQEPGATWGQPVLGVHTLF